MSGGKTAILKENEARQVHVEYDPRTGKGSPLSRYPVSIAPGKTVMLPDEAAKDAFFQAVIKARTLERLAEQKDVPMDEAMATFDAKRIQYDYEYWCSQCVTIDSEGELMPLILNGPQRHSMAVRERMRLEGKSIRQIELKHRQYGSTTEKNAYICWLQNVKYMRRHAYLISLVKGGAAKIARRYEIIAENYPDNFGSITFRGVRNAPNARMIEERQAMLSIASVTNPQAPSGDTVQFVLVSEAGKMPSNEVQSAERLITNLHSMVSMNPGTAYLVESTAELSGAWFRREVQRARKGEGQFEFTFISWTDEEDLRVSVDDIDVEAWIDGWDDYLKFLWERGCSLEQIRWYEIKREGYPNAWEMKQENPTTPDEAFQSSGTLFFKQASIVTRRNHYMHDPVAVGEMRGKTREGKEAFHDLRFAERENGSIKIWRYPDDDYGGLVKKDHRYFNRFCAYTDFGGKTDRADWSVCTVIDRFMTLHGGIPEVVARLRCHLRVDLAAWQSAQLCYWYGIALLCYETNLHKDDLGDDTRGYTPPWSMAALEQVRGVYPNLYLRQSQERADEPQSMVIGYHVGKNKETLINVLDKALDEDGFIERDQVAFSEFAFYEKKESGKLGAIQGEHDDCVMSTAGALWLSEEYMKPVLEVPINEEKKRGEVPALARF